MRIRVRVTPRASHPSVTVSSDGTLLVKVHEAAHDGKANEAVRRALADHYHVPIHAVTIVHGMSSRMTLVEITA